MRRELVGARNINFDYIIEVDGYQRPLLLLQFTLDAKMTMLSKTSGKSSRWDHVTDTRRCSIKSEREFYREVKITTLFGGSVPQFTYKGSQPLPILQAEWENGIENLVEKSFAALTNPINTFFGNGNGSCGSKKGKTRRRKALKTYKKGFKIAVEESVNQVINFLGNEAASTIRSQLKDDFTEEKLVIKKVIPRAIPEINDDSKILLAKQIHQSFTDKEPSEIELSKLMKQKNLKSMTKISSKISVEEILSKAPEIKEMIMTIDKIASRIDKIFKQGGGRRDYEDFNNSRGNSNGSFSSSVTNNLAGLPTLKSIPKYYFPDQIELSIKLEKAFETYNKSRIPVDKYLQKAWNTCRLLELLFQDTNKLENLIEELEDKIIDSRNIVASFVIYKKRLIQYINYEKTLRRYIRDVVDNTREPLPQLNLGDFEIDYHKLFDDFDDLIPDDLDLELNSDISITEFLESIPSLNKLDSKKIDLIKNEVGVIGSNIIFDDTIRKSAIQIVKKLENYSDSFQLEQVDIEIRELSNKISENFDY